MNTIYSHKILNTNNKNVILNYLVHETENHTYIVTDNVEFFDPLYACFDSADDLNKRFTFINPQDLKMKNNGYITDRVLHSIIDSVEVGDYIYFHDVMNTFKFYDKGNNRFINRIMDIMYTSDVNFIMNIDIKVLNDSMLSGDLNKFAKNECSLEFISQFRNESYELLEFNEESRKFLPKVFKSVGSILKYLKKNYSLQVNKCLSILDYLRSQNLAFEWKDMYDLCVNNSKYNVNCVEELVQMSGLNREYIYFSLIQSVYDLHKNDFSYTEIQYSFYNSDSKPFDEDKEPDYFGQRNIPHMYDWEFKSNEGRDITKTFPVSRDYQESPITEREVMFYSGIPTENELETLTKIAFGYGGRVPKKYWELVGSGESPIWEDLYNNAHSGDKNSIQLFNKLIKIMNAVNIVTPFMGHRQTA